MEKIKIAAVVVAFNRKQLLLECLEALKSQTYPLDAIYIIDGPSTDGTPETLLKNGYLNELPPEEYQEYSWKKENTILGLEGHKILVNYVRLYEDVGGSGGFHEGVKHSYENGYDWIWLMDDDAEPMKNALEELIKNIGLSNAIVLAPTVKKPTGEVSKFHRGTFSLNRCLPLIQKPLDDEAYNKNNRPVKIDFASFVGPLIKSHAVKNVGYPNKNFFIQWDDAEFCLRLVNVGKIYLVPNSTVIHKEKIAQTNIIKKSILGKNVNRIQYNKLWKSYYSRRNSAYIGNKYATNKAGFLIDLFKIWALSIITIIFFDDYKLNRICFINSAYIDGLRGIFDNEKPNRILYGDKIK